ncbi:low affinity immunoglobulin epsilon Fc receptor-like protein [Leptotrombidium deliense]|uniref:Low affinity immunoglobulin epsilon Fc receptor-like protein n=1 Tax=Leptotrombidium deliense TaxID=299467 RepID=A0A443S8N9_9ACAR|nr:low affinity immunoglobulin epsilon Fc receptor-like protein [Leptotrombidium deliense]
MSLNLFTCIACPNGWVHFSRKCYIHQKSAQSHSNAQYMCAIQGASLLSIRSLDENQFINKYLNAYGYVWTSGKRLRIGSSEFRWGDGSSMSYSNWNRNEPSDIHTSHDMCLDLDKYGGWNDFYCSEKLSYVCEKKLILDCSTTNHVNVDVLQLWLEQCILPELKRSTYENTLNIDTLNAKITELAAKSEIIQANATAISNETNENINNFKDEQQEKFEKTMSSFNAIKKINDELRSLMVLQNHLSEKEQNQKLTILKNYFETKTNLLYELIRELVLDKTKSDAEAQKFASGVQLEYSSSILIAFCFICLVMPM